MIISLSSFLQKSALPTSRLALGSHDCLVGCCHHAQNIPHICHGRCPWRIIWHVEKFIHMADCHVEKILHMRNVKKICEKYGEIMWCFFRIKYYFVAESVFFCDLRCFVAKYVSSRFLHFCFGKFNKKLCLWRKRINMRYATMCMIFDRQN